MRKLVVIAAALGIAALAAWLLLRRPAAPEGEVDWRIDDSGTPPAPLSPLARALVDRVAAADPAEASKAWLEIGARYNSSDAFLSEMKPALWDRRPAHFEMSLQVMQGNAGTFSYYTAQPAGTTGLKAYAHTVGQALCYHLWQYEDASHSGFRGPFAEWWTVFAPKHGLPAVKQ